MAKHPKWWDDLDKQEQEDYLKDHPGSKYKVTQTNNEDEKDDNEDQDHVLVKHAKSIGSYIKQNPGKVALAAIHVLSGMSNKYDKNVEGMPKHERSNLAAALRTAIGTHDSSSLTNLSKRIGLSTGVLFIGATAFSLVTGLDLSMAVPILASNFWNRIKSAPDDLEYLKNAGKAYVEQVKENLDNEDIVTKAITKQKPDVVVDTDSKKETARYDFDIATTHESDLNKTLVQVEKSNIYKLTSTLLESRASNKVQRIIDHMSGIERAMPVLTNIMVAGITLRGNISNRAKEHLVSMNRDLTRCSKELAALSSKDKNLVRTPIDKKLKSLMEYAATKTDTTYVATETGSIQPCEVHNFASVNVKDIKFNSVNVYTYKDRGQLCIAAAINSVLTPKIFDRIKVSKLDEWLKENNLRV